MGAALIAEASIRRREINPSIGMEVISATTTTTGDWLFSKFGTIHSVFCTGIGHAAFVTSIGADSKITITCTGGDIVELLVFGTN